MLEMLASTRTMLGLDQPLYVQYGTWLWKALHLDFGISFANQRPGTGRYAELPARHAGTCRCGAGINSAHSALLGIWAARHRDRLPDFAVRFIAFLARRCLTSGWRFLNGDGVFGVSAMATRDGLRRLAAHHFACGFHCLYVAGD
ncbi:hypothetical protein ACLBOM_04435 [Escherichia coli]